jgi:tRNA (mo5U34)-methyltransferase
MLYVIQHQAIQHFANDSRVHVLPFALEDLPKDLSAFDTVFSMGVLYHRRSPFDHLYDLRACLRSGGELVLETLVIDGGEGKVLVPEGRYAKMRNVWFLPSVETMMAWLKKAGFVDVSCVDVTQTTVEEQRSTDWMTFESLADFLDQGNPNLTIEGYPAPRRALFVASSP